LELWANSRIGRKSNHEFNVNRSHVDGETGNWEFWTNPAHTNWTSLGHPREAKKLMQSSHRAVVVLLGRNFWWEVVAR
jgi:hypothetical protein